MHGSRLFVFWLLAAFAAASSSACSGGEGDREPKAPGPLSELTVSFDVALDPATVNAETVRLTRANPEGPDAVPLAVALESSGRRIVARPLRPLANGRDHLLVVDGVRDRGGAAVARREQPFRTRTNRLVSSKATVHDANGPFERHTYVTVDEHAAVVRSDRYVFRDATSFERSDANLESYDVAEDRGEGVWAQSWITGPGQDGRWRTADDVGPRFTSLVDGDGDELEYRELAGPGADGTWFTADDALSSFTQRVFDAAANVVRTTEFAPGADGVPFTPDDVVSTSSAYEYDEGELRRRTIRTSQAGGDGVRFTADDPVDSYELWDYDGRGIPTRWRWYVQPGPDDTWFTDDDVLTSWKRFTIDPATGLTLETTTYVGEGDDGRWFSDDDRMFQRIEPEYDGEGQRVSATTTDFRSVSGWAVENVTRSIYEP